MGHEYEYPASVVEIPTIREPFTADDFHLLPRESQMSLSRAETIETYARAGIGLVMGIGRMLVREATYKFIVPKGLATIDMDALNQGITETAEANLVGRQ